MAGLSEVAKSAGVGVAKANLGRDTSTYVQGKDERKAVRRAGLTDPAALSSAGVGLGLAGGAVHQLRRGKLKRSMALSAGSLASSYGMTYPLIHRAQNKGRAKAGYPERTFWTGRQKTAKSLSEVAKSVRG